MVVLPRPRLPLSPPDGRGGEGERPSHVGDGCVRRAMPDPPMQGLMRNTMVINHRELSKYLGRPEVAAGLLDERKAAPPAVIFLIGGGRAF